MKWRGVEWLVAAAEGAFVTACFAALVLFRNAQSLDGWVLTAVITAALSFFIVALARVEVTLELVPGRALLLVAAIELPVVLARGWLTLREPLVLLALLACALSAVAGGVFLSTRRDADAEVDAQARRLRVRVALVLAAETALGLVLALWNASPQTLRALDATVTIDPYADDAGRADVAVEDVLARNDDPLDARRDVAQRDVPPRRDHPPPPDVSRDVLVEDSVFESDVAELDVPLLIEDVPLFVDDASEPDVVTDTAADDASDGGTCSAGMVFIPEGDPLLGYNNTPTHVRAFCIDRTEVTVAQYRVWLRRAPGNAAPSTQYLSCNWSDVPGARERHPINCVDWAQSDAYCRGTGGSLPSDEQWEYAARGQGGPQFIYPWGNDQPRDQLCWSGGSARGRQGTCAAGATAGDRSPFGVLDLAGNLFEWTAGGDRTRRSVRGASWSYSGPGFARAAYRNGGDVAYQNDDLGFRCVRGSRRIP